MPIHNELVALEVNRNQEEKAARRIDVAVLLDNGAGMIWETFWGVDAAKGFYADFAMACGTESDDTDDLLGCTVGVNAVVVDPGGGDKKFNNFDYYKV